MQLPIDFFPFFPYTLLVESEKVSLVLLAFLLFNILDLRNKDMPITNILEKNCEMYGNEICLVEINPETTSLSIFHFPTSFLVSFISLLKSSASNMEFK